MHFTHYLRTVKTQMPITFLFIPNVIYNHIQRKAKEILSICFMSKLSWHDNSPLYYVSSNIAVFHIKLKINRDITSLFLVWNRLLNVIFLFVLFYWVTWYVIWRRSSFTSEGRPQVPSGARMGTWVKQVKQTTFR
jgi:hypothetical protein